VLGFAYLTLILKQDDKIGYIKSEMEIYIYVILKKKKKKPEKPLRKHCAHKYPSE
jgi:hypothetical protein